MSDNMRAILEEASKALEEASDEKKIKLAGQLGLVLDDVLAKISSFNDIPQHYFDEVEPQIQGQIKAIDERTEQAADAILSACENMSKHINDIPEAAKKAIQNEINAIFEASNFQDLVSQHANEIKLLAEDIKADMQDIQSLTEGGDDSASSERSRNKNKRSDSHLLNGPAVQVNSAK